MSAGQMLALAGAAWALIAVLGSWGLQEFSIDFLSIAIENLRTTLEAKGR